MTTTIALAFLLDREPPGSTLFPYTTLFRSGQRARDHLHRARRLQRRARVAPHVGPQSEHDVGDGERSEAHTSELQSPDHLVCRLMLEKTKATGIGGKTERGCTVHRPIPMAR